MAGYHTVLAVRREGEGGREEREREREERERERERDGEGEGEGEGGRGSENDEQSHVGTRTRMDARGTRAHVQQPHQRGTWSA